MDGEYSLVSRSSGAPEGTPETFQMLVREALERLLDGAALQQSPLNRELFAAHEAGVSLPNPRLKRLLLEAVESLNPGGGIYFRAPQARPYHMLLLHYIEHQTIQKAAHELGISERQAYRDLRAGEVSVGAYLWNHRSSVSATQRSNAEIAPTSSTAQTNGLHPVDLSGLMRLAAGAVERLAVQQQVQINLQMEDKPLPVFADAVIARQVLTSLLSRAVQQAQSILVVELRSESPTEILLRLHLVPRRPEESIPLLDPLLAGFLQQLGWGTASSPVSYHGSDLTRQVELKIPRKNLLVLVIDDEEAFSALVRRYLAGMPVQVVSAASAEQGLKLASTLKPALILLDVMMPGMDGWEVLQTLRTRPETHACPVVICSVFDDPELARSLGASGMLPKPLAQESFLSVLSQLGILNANL